LLAARNDQNAGHGELSANREEIQRDRTELALFNLNLLCDRRYVENVFQVFEVFCLPKPIHNLSLRIRAAGLQS